MNLSQLLKTIFPSFLCGSAGIEVVCHNRIDRNIVNLQQHEIKIDMHAMDRIFALDICETIGGLF
jgi:hypothetical protein